MGPKIEKVLWDEFATPREKVVMLMILAEYGDTGFSDNHAHMSERFNMPVSKIRRALSRLKKMGWIQSKRTYEPGTHNLRFISGCEYSITL